jgi:hypothetical protein
MRELTMVDLSVYTNHRMGDMYYNNNPTPPYSYSLLLTIEQACATSICNRLPGAGADRAQAQSTQKGENRMLIGIYID